MKKQFQVEATVSMKVPSDVDTNDRRAIRDWLVGPFYHHDNDYTLSGDELDELMARVTYDLDLDLSRIPQGDLNSQLDALHKLAIEEMTAQLGSILIRIYQLDVLVTDRP